MAKKEHLYKLFDAHTKDLNNILIHPAEIIACPICLRVFDRTAVDREMVNDGHVWSKDIRKKSKTAGQMQVILCKSCNEKAGIADKQMQLDESLRRGDVTGQMYGVRSVKFVEEGNDKPIELRLKVQVKSGSLHIEGRIDKNRRILDTDPVNHERLQAILRGEKKVSVMIDPLKGYKSEKVPSAFITAAYLMAFYALGYRYILQEDVKVVRDYIRTSFESELDPVPNDEDFALEKYEDNYYDDPLLHFVVPDVGREYLLVSFLNVAVRLPFIYNPSFFEKVLKYLKARRSEEFQKMLEAKHPLVIRIPCTKTIVHDCLFDYLMGKPEKPTGEYKLIVDAG